MFAFLQAFIYYRNRMMINTKDNFFNGIYVIWKY